MPIANFEAALIQGDTNLYFEIRKHFPLDLIQSEVELLPDELKKRYNDLERQWRSIQPIKVGDRVMVDQPELIAHGKLGTIVSPDKIPGWWKVKLDHIDGDWLAQYHPSQLILQ